MDSSSMRTTVVTFEVMRMCFSSVGRKPARSNADTVKNRGRACHPGTCLACWSGNRAWPQLPSLRKSTPRSRPSAAVPAASCTTPRSLPETGFACAAAGIAGKDETMTVRTRAPRIRSRPCFTLSYLPGAAFAAVLVSGGGAFYRELCRARNGLIRKPVRSIHFNLVLPWWQRC